MRRYLSIACALLAALLLSGYAVVNNLVNWVYFGTPLTVHPYEPSTGAPTMVEYSRTLPTGLPSMPSDLLSKVNYTLPEGRDIRLNSQGLIPDSDDKTNIRFAADAEVWVTFVTEGAGYRNSVGFFVYDPESPPTSQAAVNEKMIFVNASTPSPLDSAGAYQNTIKLGSFRAGQALGFMIVSDGYSSTGRLYNGARIGGVKDNVRRDWTFYTLRQLNAEASSVQNLNVHTVMLKDLSGSSDGYQRLVIGFEDINREYGGDHDFNDVVLAIHVTPRTSIANFDTIQPLVSAVDLDSDGDGVKDALDEFPADSTRAFSRYYPGSDVWGTLAFEDQWPAKGDYDLNDVVVQYRTREIMNAARQVVAMQAEYRFTARGGLVDSGFGVSLPGISAASIASASLSVGGAAATAIQSESGQSLATFIITPRVRTYLPFSSNGNCPFANTVDGCGTTPPVDVKLEARFSSPLASSLFVPPYNPFIYRTDRRGQEVHLPGKAPTARADLTLLRTLDDRSVLNTTTTYVDANRRPWALDIPTAWAYPKERKDVLLGYPRMADWATSSGASARDWFLNGVLSQHIYPAP